LKLYIYDKVARKSNINNNNRTLTSRCCNGRLRQKTPWTHVTDHHKPTSHRDWEGRHQIRSEPFDASLAVSVKVHLRDGRTDCPSVRPSLRWSLTLTG